MKNDNIKNDNLKSEWSTFSIYRKICFVIFVVLITSLILGSVGGLFYLFKPKKVNADEIVIDGGTTSDLVSTVIVPLNVAYYLPGGYSSYPGSVITAGNYSIQQPLIFRVSRDEASYFELGAYNGIEYIYGNLAVSDGSGSLTFTLYDGVSDVNILFYIQNLNSTSLTCSYIYSIQVVYLSGSGESVVFNITDIDGNIFSYALYPYRAEQFGEYTLNPYDGNDFLFTYMAYSGINYTEVLNQAKEESYNNGYDEGYRDGKKYGINVGYNQGVNDTDKFTFSSLLNAIFYAPLKAFISIFNFEVLGVNVLNIISFFFTMLIALGIIRWVV